jgi:hypothetical protein
MERLVELLARVLIAKGVEYAVAYMVAREQAAAVGVGGDDCNGRNNCMGCCGTVEAADLEDTCFFWDTPQGRH